MQVLIIAICPEVSSSFGPSALLPALADVRYTCAFPPHVNVYLGLGLGFGVEATSAGAVQADCERRNWRGKL
jgi:hypothetical protein